VWYCLCMDGWMFLVLDLNMFSPYIELRPECLMMTLLDVLTSSILCLKGDHLAKNSRFWWLSETLNSLHVYWMIPGVIRKQLLCISQVMGYQQSKRWCRSLTRLKHLSTCASWSQIVNVMSRLGTSQESSASRHLRSWLHRDVTHSAVEEVK
jgi:hypothetical protein